MVKAHVFVEASLGHLASAEAVGRKATWNEHAETKRLQKEKNKKDNAMFKNKRQVHTGKTQMEEKIMTQERKCVLVLTL